MLDDRNVIDDVNPYVAYDFSLPGTTRKTFEFSDFSEKIEEKGAILQDENLKGVAPNKELIPKLNIDHGFTKKRERKFAKKEEQKQKPVNFDNIEYVIYKNTDTRVLVLGVILSMILLISMR